jgi:hypothetical protein
MGYEGRPEGSIREVWRQYRERAHTSRTKKAATANVRLVVLAMGVVAALLSAVATLFPTAPIGDPLTVAGGLSAAAALLLAIAGLLGRELLAPADLSEWRKNRVLGEGLKREAWMALIRLPPYDGDDADVELGKRMAEFEKNIGLPTLELPGGELDRPVPEVDSFEDYLEKRARDQIRFYSKALGDLQRKGAWFKVLTIVLGCLSIVLGAVGAFFGSLISFLPVFTTATAAVVALQQAQRVKSLIPLYQSTRRQLRTRLARWSDGEDDRAAWTEAGETEKVAKAEHDCAKACEEILARENESWRVEWTSEEPKPKDVGETTGEGTGG